MVRALLTTAALMLPWVWIFATMGTPYTPAELARKSARSSTEQGFIALAGFVLLLAMALASLAALWWAWAPLFRSA